MIRIYYQRVYSNCWFVSKRELFKSWLTWKTIEIWEKILEQRAMQMLNRIIYMCIYYVLIKHCKKEKGEGVMYVR
ncbi:hypothetical protein D7D81_17155 [Halocella sp. SP3-1]|nr:hypothetical protein D7D81_17155 [Halocella sp. SP3-1]